MVERFIRNEKVRGSTPRAGSFVQTEVIEAATVRHQIIELNSVGFSDAPPKSKVIGNKGTDLVPTRGFSSKKGHQTVKST